MEVEKPCACASKNSENDTNGIKKEMSDVNGATSASKGKFLDFVI